MYRGANISFAPAKDIAHIQSAKDFGYNLIRLQFHTIKEGFTFIDSWTECLADIETVLQNCREVGINIILDCHQAPYDGFIAGSANADQWNDQILLANFKTVWTDLATLSQNYLDVVWGYDLFNEPVAPSISAWMNIAVQIIDTIRAIDATRYIIYEESPWALTLTKPLPSNYTNIIYSFHFYAPLAFTHQGIASIGYKYPRSFPYTGDNCIIMDHNYLYEKLIEIKNFVRDNKVNILVGEYSVIRWADIDSSLYWFETALNYFDSQGWSYLYHTHYDPWIGWDLAYEGAYEPNHNYVETNKLSRPIGRDTYAAALIKSYLVKNNL
jgi:aryl-phospho-beta-D-glucosidase BglC (GH1 family)